MQRQRRLLLWSDSLVIRGKRSHENHSNEGHEDRCCHQPSRVRIARNHSRSEMRDLGGRLSKVMPLAAERSLLSWSRSILGGVGSRIQLNIRDTKGTAPDFLPLMRHRGPFQHYRAENNIVSNDLFFAGQHHPCIRVGRTSGKGIVLRRADHVGGRVE